MVRLYVLALVLFLILPVVSGEPIKWSGENGFRDWGDPVRLDMSQRRGVLRLSIHGRDSHITNRNVSIDTEKYKIVEIEYRAEDLPERTSGQIYFAGKSQAGFVPNQFWEFYNLKSDGEWHVLRLHAERAVRHKNWEAIDVVDKIRLDMVDQHPGIIEIRRISFLKPPQPQTAWSGENNFEGWENPVRLDMERKNGLLALSVTGPDSSITNYNVEIDPKRYREVEIEYRAEGLPERTSGQIFFAGKSQDNFAGNQLWEFYNLKSDGEWHKLKLHADSAVRNRNWDSHGIIDKIRLDMVDQHPGLIEIRSIRFIDTSRGVSEVRSFEELNLQGKAMAGASAFREGAAEFRIQPGNYHLWCLARSSQAPGRISEHLKVEGGTLSRAHGQDAGEWRLLGAVEVHPPGLLSFRWDKSSEPDFDTLLLALPGKTPEFSRPEIPETVEVEFGSPPPGHVRTMRDIHSPYWNSLMVAPRGRLWASGDFLIRTEFNVKPGLEKAVFQVATDDRILSLYVNGNAVDHSWSHLWTTPDTVDLTGFLRAGRNVIALKYRNYGAIGSVMFDLGLLYRSGLFDLVSAHDGSVGFSGEAPANWHLPDFDDSGWAAVDTHPAPPSSPWNVDIPYFCMAPGAGKAVLSAAELPAAPESLEDVSATVFWKGNPDFNGDEAFYARIYDQNSNLIAFKSAPLAELESVIQPDGALKVVFDEFDLPRYGGEIQGLWEFGIYGRKLETAENQNFDFRLQARKIPGRTPRIHVEKGHPHPRVIKNGEPFYFNMLPAASRGDLPALKSGRKSPFNLVALRTGGLHAPWWTGPGEYDFFSIDRRLSELAEDFPESYLGVYSWAQPHHWYNDLYPERISRQDDGTIYGYYMSTVTFSDPEYRKDAAEAFSALVEHVEKHFGSRVLLYVIMGGLTCEWQGWSTSNPKFADYSSAARRDFRSFTSERYPGAGWDDIPSPEARLASDGNSMFRHPARNADAIAYDEYYSESIADCIAEIAAAAKQASGASKLVGSYYGYHLEYGNLRYRLNEAGHNALGRLLESPDLDFLLSPQSYGVRQLGAPNDDMKPFRSLALAGILSIIEDDSRTHLIPPTGHSQTVNLKQTAAVMRRNIGMSLARKQPLTFFPIMHNHTFNHPSVLEDFNAGLNAGRLIYDENRQTASEIAVVIDESSLNYLSPVRDDAVPVPDDSRYHYSKEGKLLSAPRRVLPLTGELMYYQRIALSQVGAPVDYILLKDVPSQASEYKMFVFLTSFSDSRLLRESFRKIREAGGTYIVVYGAGFIGDSGTDPELMSEVTGIRMELAPPGASMSRIIDFTTEGTAGIQTVTLGTEGYPLSPRFAVNDPDAAAAGEYIDGGGVSIAFKKTGEGMAVFFGPEKLSPDFLRSVARNSGVHIYSESNDNMHVGCGIISVHSRLPGPKTILLREKTDAVDIFSGEVAARNSDVLKLDMEPLETRVLMLGTAEKILRYLNK